MTMTCQAMGGALFRSRGLKTILDRIRCPALENGPSDSDILTIAFPLHPQLSVLCRRTAISADGSLRERIAGLSDSHSSQAEFSDEIICADYSAKIGLYFARS